MKIKLFALCVALCSAQVYSATEWHVYSDTRDGLSGTQQLTNAFKRAQSGDTITIHAGTYNIIDIGEMMDPYFTSATQTEYTGAGTCYFTMTANLTVQGDPACRPDEVVLSGKGTSANNYGQRRPLHLGGDNCVVRNLTLAYGNCNFTRYINGVSQGWNYRRGGGIAFGKATSTVTNCIFHYCYGQQGSAVINGKIQDCTFDTCLGYPCLLWTDEIRKCRFISCPGAIKGCTGTISGCSFISCSSTVIQESAVEISDCAFSNNTALCISPSGTSPISHCIFSGNNCGAGVASCISGFTGKISDCTFTGAYDFLADCTDVEDCEFYSNGTTMTGSTSIDATPARRCALSNCSFDKFGIHWGSVLIDPISARNCLFTGNTMWGNNFSGLFQFTEGATSAVAIENCTVVSNQSNSTYSNFGTGIVTFENCLFFSNKTGGQAQGRFDFWLNPTDGVTFGRLESARFYNSVFKINESIDGMTVTGGGNFNMYGKTFDPRFKGADDPAHPYALKRRSDYVGQGKVESWMSTAADLAGSPRLRDGKVDIGCYQNWDPVPGMLLMLR